MKKSVFLFLSIVVFTLHLKASNLTSNNKIIWDSVHFPPSLISEGDYKYQGYSDMARELFIINLKNYDHEVITGSLEKAMQDLEHGENFCFAGLSKNEFREKFILYSKPYLYSLPNELIIKTKDKKRFKSYIGMKSEVNLHKLLQNNGFTFGYLKHRSYSPYIDRLIELNYEKKHLLPKEDKERSVGLTKMLAQGQIDYIIEYPTTFNYSKDEEEVQEEFSMFPIYESSKKVKVYVGCTQNKFGKKVISQINNIIDENSASFESFYRTWLDYDSKKMLEQLGK